MEFVEGDHVYITAPGSSPCFSLLGVSVGVESDYMYQVLIYVYLEVRRGITSLLGVLVGVEGDDMYTVNTIPGNSPLVILVVLVGALSLRAIEKVVCCSCDVQQH